MSQCVAVCCSVLLCCKDLQCVTACYSVLQCVAVRSRRLALQVFYSHLPPIFSHQNCIPTCLCTSTYSICREIPIRTHQRYNTLQHTGTHCNALQYTATHCKTHSWKDNCMIVLQIGAKVPETLAPETSSRPRAKVDSRQGYRIMAVFSNSAPIANIFVPFDHIQKLVR